MKLSGLDLNIMNVNMIVNLWNLWLVESCVISWRLIGEYFINKASFKNGDKKLSIK